MVLSATIGALGALGAAGISAGAGAAGANAGFHNQMDLQAQAALLNYIYARKSAINSPSWQREGLTKAGYNPMLAVQNATSGVNSSWTSSGNAPTPDYSGVVSNALDFLRLRNETAQSQSVVHLQNAQADTEVSKQKNFEFQNAMTDVETHLKQKDLDNYDKRFYTEMYEMMQRAEKMRQEASVVGYNAESQRILANAQVEANKVRKYTADVNAETERGTVSSRFPLGIGTTRYYSPENFNRMFKHGR